MNGNVVEQAQSLRRKSRAIVEIDAQALQFGTPNGAATSFSFKDGSVDLVVVRGLSEGDEVLYERWLRPSLLPLP